MWKLCSHCDKCNMSIKYVWDGHLWYERGKLLKVDWILYWNYVNGYSNVAMIAYFVICFIHCNWQNLFFKASSFNGDISSWDVSKVTYMSVSIICEYCVLIMKHVLWESSMAGMDICDMNGGKLTKVDWI